MATIAKLNTARVSAQKCRLVADQIRGLKVDKAIDLLAFSPKKISSDPEEGIGIGYRKC